ncbi:hypothetical protein ABZ208_14245 [Streptomyces sp. NPDC006208]
MPVTITTPAGPVPDRTRRRHTVKHVLGVMERISFLFSARTGPEVEK